MWIALDSQERIDDLLDQFNGFHDGCLREVWLVTETYVDEHRAVACPGHLDTSALLYFQSQNESLSAIEVRCVGLSEFRLRPTPDNCDSIISFGSIALDGESCRLAVCFIAGPLTGPPNTTTWLPPRSLDDPDLVVIARSIAWRPLERAFGKTLRYGRGAK